MSADQFIGLSSLKDPIHFERIFDDCLHRIKNTYGFETEINFGALNSARNDWIEGFANDEIADLSRRESLAYAIAHLIETCNRRKIARAVKTSPGNVVKQANLVAKENCNLITAVNFGGSVFWLVNKMRNLAMPTLPIMEFDMITIDRLKVLVKELEGSPLREKTTPLFNIIRQCNMQFERLKRV